ncbi:Cu(I)/Ag(I) efflux system protein CusF [Collimonas sp. OK607]|uniref:copper-binding protein n=1 Tax=Collimonas sp. OK607 TaxID=1798194 RepID=UPI0008EA2A47|nr:copper-binding protein [Collimonas sp. OK607]SFB13571.1 Cu(I)/Ag(I) efflux system protein CusF [Collimonas sp. OK607]
MKPIAILSLLLALSASGAALAQSTGTKNMDMKGMDMKTMPMDNMSSSAAAKVATHQATGVVKAVDMTTGTVTLAHGPVKSLNWPAMTMTFVVKDKMFFDKLAVDKKVTIDFAKQGTDYVVSSVK